MRGGENITDNLNSWNTEEELSHWRGKKPIEEPPLWVYFVRKDFIVGRVKYVDYRYKNDKNLQGEIQGGGAFKLKGPCVKPLQNIKIPTNILKGQWRWRYIRDGADFDEIRNRINESFKDI